MFKQSFPFCLNHLWAQTFSICSSENGTTLYCARKAVCVGHWAISHVNGCFYWQFSILRWQWHGFGWNNNKKTHLIRTFFLFNNLLHIFIFSFIILQLLGACYFYLKALNVSYQRVAHVIYTSLIPYSVSTSLWGQLIQFWNHTEFIKLIYSVEVLRKTYWIYLSFKLDFL